MTPSASLQPEVPRFDAYRHSLVEWAADAKRRGFRAAKAEVTLAGPYAHVGLREPYERATEVIAAVRAAVGDDFVLMVDCQYAFPDADECLRVIRAWQDFDLFFVESPLPSDDLAGYARLAREQPIPIAAGEWLTTRFEFAQLIRDGQIRVAQPDVGRVGGLTEALRVSKMTQAEGVIMVPHLWKTGISIAAAVHLAAVTGNCPYVEYLPPELSESPLRRELLTREPVMAAGQVTVPDIPGLGIELSRDAIDRFAGAARRVRL